MIPAWLGGIWTKVLIAGAFVLLALGAVLKLIGIGRKQEQANQFKREGDMRRKADEVERRVDAAGPDERERLRNKWTRP